MSRGYFLAPEEDERRRRLYDAGCNDTEIARVVGVQRFAISAWRLRRGLAGIYRPGKLPTSENAAQLREKARGTKRLGLYEAGLNDRQIAKAEGCSVSTVKSWRRKRLLTANRPHAAKVMLPEDDDLRRRMHAAGGWDALIGRLVQKDWSVIRMWRCRRQLSKNGVPSVVAIRTVSLDDTVGDSGATRLDFVADQSQSEWLEEMGATVW